MRSCWLYSDSLQVFPRSLLFSCKLHQIQLNPFPSVSLCCSLILSFSLSIQGAKRCWPGCSCQPGVLVPVQVFYTRLGANTSQGANFNLCAKTRLGTLGQPRC